MLVEIPNPEVILGVIFAFLAGLGAWYGYSRARLSIKNKNGVDVSVSERLEYYERQLIDMQMKLDMLEIQKDEQITKDPSGELKQFLEKLAKSQVQPVEPIIKEPIVEEKPVSTPKNSHIEFANLTDSVLHIITNKVMTSRDIQITLRKSREHTSRLMKKLFEDGYVQRNTDSKPYTYSITEKGKARVDELLTKPLTT